MDTGFVGRYPLGTIDWVEDQLERNLIDCDRIDDSQVGIVLFHRDKRTIWMQDEMIFIRRDLVPPGILCRFSSSNTLHIGNFQ